MFPNSRPSCQPPMMISMKRTNPTRRDVAAKRVKPKTLASPTHRTDGQEPFLPGNATPPDVSTTVKKFSALDQPTEDPLEQWPTTPQRSLSTPKPTTTDVAVDPPLTVTTVPAKKGRGPTQKRRAPVDLPPRPCMVCGKDLTGKRSDALTCSSACRIQLKRVAPHAKSVLSLVASPGQKLHLPHPPNKATSMRS